MLKVQSKQIKNQSERIKARSKWKISKQKAIGFVLGTIPWIVLIVLVLSLKTDFFDYFLNYFKNPSISAESFYPTIDLFGQTTPVLLDGVNNAGNIHFENPLYLPAPEYKAYLVKTGPTEYEMRGWAWSDNLGWISFYCKDGKNPGTPGLSGGDCGSFDHTITINADGKFKGYAWNDAMGWISMGDLNHPGQGAPYGISMDASGNFSGYGYSQSLGWINFTGVYANLEIVIPPTANCKTDEYIGVCVDLMDTSNGYTIPAGLQKYMDMGYDMPNLGRIADGKDKFTLQLYFKNKDNFISKADFTDGKYDVAVSFNWDDTLKRVQTTKDSKAGILLNNEKASITKGGGVLYKPILLSNVSTSDPSYEQILNKSWTNNILNLDIKSVAPTTNANLSSVVKYPNKVVKNDKGPEDNHLHLSSMEWTLIDKTVNPNRTYTGTTTIGEKGILEFFPALSVTTLNTDTTDNQDVIVAYRNIPVGIEVKGEYFGATDSKGNPASIINLTVNDKTIAKVDFNIIYDNKEGFDFGFKEDTKISAGETLIKSTNQLYSSVQILFLNTIQPWKPSLIAKLSKDSLPAAYTSGAKLETEISYEVPQSIDGQIQTFPVYYFSNFLPRLTESNIANPVAVIKGQIYGEAYTPQAGINTTGIGDKNINIVKDTIYENIQKLIRNQTLPIHKEGTAILSNFTTDCINSCMKISSNDDEDILYINADKVVLENGGADITWPKNTVLIVNSGNLFINDNLYNGKNNTKSLGIVVTRNTNDDIGAAGNIYISKNVTNIQAFAVAWGVVFSYDGDYDNANIDKNTGEFTWTADIPSTLNKQLLWQGGVSSYNTIGGTDKNPGYYLTGYGVLPKGTDKDEDNRKTAQLYDLNYLRYFQLQIQYDTNGNPIDMQCGKGLTSEEIAIIDAGGTLPPPKQNCNGIDPLKTYKAEDPESGDLVPGSDTLKAKDAGDDRTSPVYIEFVKPYEKSSIFSKEKSLTF